MISCGSNGAPRLGDADAGPPPGAFVDAATATDSGRADSGDIPSRSRGIPAAEASLDFGEGRADPDIGSVDARTCFDGINNDDVPTVDCDDPGCAGLGSCCVGRDDCCATSLVVGVPSEANFLECADLSCLGTGWRTIGRSASVSTDGFSPEGTADGDGGGAFLETIPLHTSRVRTTVTLTPPSDCGADCLEGLSIGYLAEVPDGVDGVVVVPEVALTYSGGRDAVSLVLSGREHSRYPREGVREFTLEVTPAGRVLVFRGAEALADVPDALIPRALHLGVWGRSRNPSASEMRSVAIERLAVDVSLCDMPTAWEARDVLDIAGTAPSLADRGVDTALAYVDGNGEIQLAELRSEGFVDVGDPLSAERAGVDALDDPELMDGADGWEVFFTALRGGRRDVYRATFDADEGWSPDDDPVMRDSWAPTVSRSATGTRLLIVRRADGLHAFEDSEGSFARIDGDLGAMTVPGELGTPSVVLHDRAWHLYVPYRRGTRWEVALLASDDAVNWRSIGRTIGPSAYGFDKLGVAHVDALARPDRIELVYEGEDGVRRRLGRAVRAGTSAGERL